MHTDRYIYVCVAASFIYTQLFIKFSTYIDDMRRHVFIEACGRCLYTICLDPTDCLHLSAHAPAVGNFVQDISFSPYCVFGDRQKL